MLGLMELNSKQKWFVLSFFLKTVACNTFYEETFEHLWMSQRLTWACLIFVLYVPLMFEVFNILFGILQPVNISFADLRDFVTSLQSKLSSSYDFLVL